jgi:hypothetical protein
MRVNTTVVETDIHHPTDSTLLGDRVRVLTRIMGKITKIAGAVGTKLRDRSREREAAAAAGDRAGRARQRSDQSGQVELALSPIVELDSRVVGQATLSPRDHSRREAVDDRVAAAGAGRAASGARRDDVARAAADEADQGAPFPPCRAETRDFAQISLWRSGKIPPAVRSGSGVRPSDRYCCAGDNRSPIRHSPVRT